MDKAAFSRALRKLDKKINRPLNLLVGGGGALVLGHQMPLSTLDIDAIPFRSDWTVGQLDKKVKEVARKLDIPPDWLNPHFVTFSYVLPGDYDKRLISIYKGKHLNAFALGAEDLLILKCFAGRAKDVGHARFLMKKCENIRFVEKHLEKMLEDRIPKAQDALDFFDEIKSSLGK